VSKLEEIKIQNIYNLFIQQTLSGDTINNVFRARCRREGDVILSGGHTHKLKKLYSDKKIPRSERHALPVVERDGAVVWIPGVRLADGEGRGGKIVYLAYCI
jgi:tRNA(Ile)-lysidine synthetase-like protein